MNGRPTAVVTLALPKCLPTMAGAAIVLLLLSALLCRLVCNVAAISMRDNKRAFLQTILPMSCSPTNRKECISVIEHAQED